MRVCVCLCVCVPFIFIANAALIIAGGIKRYLRVASTTGEPVGCFWWDEEKMEVKMWTKNKIVTFSLPLLIAFCTGIHRLS